MILVIYYLYITMGKVCKCTDTECHIYRYERNFLKALLSLSLVSMRLTKA